MGIAIYHMMCQALCWSWEYKDKQARVPALSMLQPFLASLPWFGPVLAMCEWGGPTQSEGEY